MVSSILTVGDKVDIQHRQKQHQYKSKILEVVDEETLRLLLPIEKSVVVPLAKGRCLELTFCCKKGVYRCSAEVIDRYKEDNIYLMLVRITSELEKIQRRKFYRLPYAMEIEFREVKKEDEISLEEQEEALWNRGVTLDLSGGGCRFNSSATYDVETQLEIRFFVDMESGSYEQIWIGKVTSSSQIPNRPDMYETRVEFIDTNRQRREQLIKFIFEEERKMRRKERGMDY